MSDRPDHSTSEHGETTTSQSLVGIFINNLRYRIEPGEHTVAKIKALGQVSPADDLLQIVHGQMVPLADDGSVKIHGSEVFISHPKSGGSA